MLLYIFSELPNVMCHQKLNCAKSSFKCRGTLEPLVPSLDCQISAEAQSTTILNCSLPFWHYYIIVLTSTGRAEGLQSFYKCLLTEG